MKKQDYSFLANRMARKSRKSFEVLKPCPLCNTMLRKGETIHSHAFTGPKKQNGGSGRSNTETADHLVHIFGCPYCYPANREHPRTCPVCGAELGEDAYVIARMFENRGKARRHVHVLGCSHCKMG